MSEDKNIKRRTILKTGLVAAGTVTLGAMTTAQAKVGQPQDRPENVREKPGKIPVRKFGNINFPAGGAATDGFWRFQYVTVEVSPYPTKVSLSLPENPERVVTN